MSKPYIVVDKGEPLYSLNGKLFPPERLGRIPGWRTLLAVPTKNIKVDGMHQSVVDAETLENSKAFARKYLVKLLHERTECEVNAAVEYGVTLSESLEEKAYQAEQKKGNKKFRELETKLITHNYKTGEAGSEARYQMIAAAVEGWLNDITLERVNQDIPEVRERSAEIRHPGGPAIDGFSDSKSLVARIFHMYQKNNFSLDKYYEKMPEWMQVLTHDIGFYVTTTHKYKEESKYNGVAYKSDMGHDMMTIFMNPRARSEEGIVKTLREELLHGLQARSDVPHSFMEGCSEIGQRWYTTTEPLIAQINAEGKDSKVFALISKTEPTGGSLMTGSKLIQPQELLVDIFDAEIYLRNVEKLDAKDTEKRLKDTFGEVVYNAAYEYVQGWIDQASKLLEKQIGHEEAERYRQKWTENPFTHRITLSELPQYKLNENTQAIAKQ